jgi:hypothetical protein
VSASADPLRAQWSATGATTEHPAESGERAISTFMDVTLNGAPCQYLRVEIEPHGWVMLGEIEVYGE